MRPLSSLSRLLPLLALCSCTAFSDAETSQGENTPQAGASGKAGAASGGASGAQGGGAAGKTAGAAGALAGQSGASGQAGASPKAGAAGTQGGAGSGLAGASGAGQGGNAAGAGAAGQGGQSSAGVGGSAGSTAGSGGSGGQSAGASGSAAGDGGASGDAGQSGTGGSPEGGAAGDGGAGSPGAGEGGGGGESGSSGGDAGQGGAGAGQAGAGQAGAGMAGAGQGGAGQGGSGQGGAGMASAGQGGAGSGGAGMAGAGGAGTGGAGQAGAGGSVVVVPCQGTGFKLNPATGHCYYKDTTNKTWQQARDACQALGPGFDLATPSSGAELDFVLNFVNAITDTYWIGGTDQKQEGNFTWVDGASWTYTPMNSPWLAGEPNNFNGEDCVEIKPGFIQGGLNDSECLMATGYVCERPPTSGPLCRNGIKEAGEECDDGNIDNTDGCTITCKVQICGDGVVQGGEQCDDANQIDTDACKNNCTLPCTSQGMFENPTTGHCYYFNALDKTWSDARAACQALGPGFDLAAPSTIAELTWLANALPGGAKAEPIWLGGNDIQFENQYQWTNGEPWTYTPIQPPWTGSPASATDCIVLEPPDGIDDNSCGNSHPYLCERP